MDKNQAQLTRKMWLVIGLLLLGYGVGGGLSRFSDNGLTVPVLMQLGGGLIGSIIAFIQAQKNK